MSEEAPKKQGFKADADDSTATQDHTQVPILRPAHDRPKRDRGGNKAWPKNDYRHWLPRMEMRDGRGYYETRFYRSGVERRLSFQTRSKEDAARQAAEVWKDVERLGWDAAFRKVRPPVQPKAGTVGALIAAAKSLSMARPQSLDAYEKAFRRIVAGVCNITDAGKFKDAGKAYRAKVDGVRLDKITPSAVKAWRNEYIRSAGRDATARNRAVITTNSLLRNARGLFARKHLADIGALVILPPVLPLDGVPLEKPPSLRYKSLIDARAILAAARDELAQTDSEAFKLLLLTLVCGLRRSEADLLTWSAFDFANRRLQLQDTEFHRLKSADSSGTVDLDVETAALFQGFHAKKRGVFVLDGPQHAPQGRNRAYRVEGTHQRLLVWLRSQGVSDARPIHTMRKEIGSIVATDHGLFSAQRYLRHSTPTITAAFYADIKKPITAGLGDLLASTDGPIPFTAPAASAPDTSPPLKKKRTAKH